MGRRLDAMCVNPNRNMFTWTLNFVIAVVGARAFITSQSAEAHLILFRRIFEIASSDSGLTVSILHIHGHGIESCIADGHKGQGLGKTLQLPIAVYILTCIVFGRLWTLLSTP